MVKKNTSKQPKSSTTTDTTQLLNFHFASPPAQVRSSGSSNHRSNNPGRKQHQKKEYQRTAEDRVSVRRKAARNMFPLHSSPDHAFVLTRKTATAAGSSNNYTFSGPDEAVSWESVRIVKYLVSLEQRQDQQENNYQCCPICLDPLQCARITKCGHCFCLPCLIHHVQSDINNNNQKAPKCPCCAVPLHLDDVRPVQIVTVNTPPTTTTTHSTRMRFVKLHRVKDCPAPYLPLPGQPRRSSLHAAPTDMLDADAHFCKFNYLNVTSYQQLLHHNMYELVEQHQQHHAAKSSSPLEALCIDLSIQRVQQEWSRALLDAVDETTLSVQFQNPTSGMYQPQSSIHAMTTTVQSIDTSPVARTMISSSSTWDDKQLVNEHLNHQNYEPYLGQQIVSPSSSPPRTSEPVIPAVEDESCHRERGDSIVSHGASSACSHPSATAQRHSSSAAGSMYLNIDDEYVLYQAVDGSLCFLSGFNMNCLQTEFSTTMPSAATTPDDEHYLMRKHRVDDTSPPTSPRQQPAPEVPRLPLPDMIEGRVLEVERVHLTADVRQRRRFLSHLPLYSDICFVEISLSHILSNRTKKAFKKEFQKRHQSRIAREAAEKKVDERVQRKEEERINDLKARIQRVDPLDEFFQPVIVPEQELNLSGTDFGPFLSGAPATITGGVRDVNNTKTDRRSTGVSFSQICRAGEDFPSLNSAPTETNFPALGSSPPIPKRAAPPPRPWGTTLKTAPPGSTASATIPAPSPVVVAPISGKKGKGKKIVLFSTGGQRGYF